MSDFPPRPRTRLYLITPPHVEEMRLFCDTLMASLKTGGDVACLQVRQKDGDRINLQRTQELAALLLPPLRERGIELFINDSVEIAKSLGADGVHLGAQDLGVREARKILGAEFVIGATAKNSRHVAMQAGEDGADYVAFGAFYPTATKAGTVVATLDILEIWQEIMEIPCVAIGGIMAENAAPLVRAGADFLAVSAGVFGAVDWGAAMARFNAVFDEVAVGR